MFIRTVEHKEKEYVNGKNHINGLEGFWGYLKRKLAAKGGIRRAYLYLFLGEYVWRYNILSDYPRAIPPSRKATEGHSSPRL